MMSYLGEPKDFNKFLIYLALKLILFGLIFGLAAIEVSADVINVVVNGQYEMIQKQTIRRLLYFIGIPFEIVLFVINALVYKKTGTVLF